MKVLENLKRNGSTYATLLVSVIAIFPDMIQDMFWRVIIIIIALIIAIYFVNVSSPEQEPHDKRIKSQWDLFGLLLERHKQLMNKSYLWALILPFLLLFLFYVVLFYKREELICLIRKDREIIFGYLFVIIGIYSFYLWKHVYTKKYYNLAQLLWAQIENLRDELESKNLGGLKDNLDEYGNQKLYHLMLKLRDGKMPNDFSREEIENIIDAEATVIEQIKVKVESSNGVSFWNKLYYNFKRSI